MFGRFGDSDWWLGENSLFGRGLQTVADTGLVGQFKGNFNLDQSSTSMESEFLKYGGLALLVYLVVKK